jgi:metal-dependent amidase/aminoacylase/carboxypeptidase family protein
MMGGEDFSYFTLERPGYFFNVGTRNEARGITWPHHHPRFDIEERAWHQVWRRWRVRSCSSLSEASNPNCSVRYSKP